MNNLKSITIYIIIFIVLTLGITFVIILKNNQQKELNCATPEPIQFCGTDANSSEEAIEGKHLFNSNCAACHSFVTIISLANYF
jgi:cytochrome c5